MDETKNNLDEGEINIGEIFKALLNYKWSIILTLTIVLILSFYYLYNQTPMYVSCATIEVKSSGTGPVKGDDFIGSTFTDLGKEKVDKEIEILKTFNINNHALNKLNFATQYFIDAGFKKIEI